MTIKGKSLCKPEHTHNALMPLSHSVQKYKNHSTILNYHKLKNIYSELYIDSRLEKRTALLLFVNHKQKPQIEAVWVMRWCGEQTGSVEQHVRTMRPVRVQSRALCSFNLLSKVLAPSVEISESMVAE